MKEVIEEYGGVILACFMGLMLLGVLAGLMNAEGGLYHLAQIFSEGVGSMCNG